MFTDLETLRTDVKDRLTPILPEEWKYEPTIEGTVKALAPVLYIEFVRVDTKLHGEPLGRGQATATLNLIITDPKSDTTKAEDSADAHLLKLLGAVDQFDDLFWDNAEKKRLPNGPLAWSVSCFAIVSTTTTEE